MRTLLPLAAILGLSAACTTAYEPPEGTRIDGPPGWVDPVNSEPRTCSPDGRLVAFFSRRTSGDGPGLYVMRTDGWRAQKIADVVGDSLQWSRQ